MRSAIHCYGVVGMVVCSVLLMSGCGGGLKLIPVEGTVTLDGEPVEGATVLFEPAEGGKPATGTTDAAGKFVLTTLEQGDGAVPGTNKVAVTKVKVIGSRPVGGASSADAEGEEASGDMEEQVEFIVPAEYANTRTSPLTVEVKSGMDPVPLDIQSN